MGSSPTSAVGPNRYWVRPVSSNDPLGFLSLAQTLPASENHFTNELHGKNPTEYREWLQLKEDWARGHRLPDGYVPETTFWLMVGPSPVGVGKLRHRLTSASRVSGGSIGYSIFPSLRGKGLGSIFVALLVEEAKRIGMRELLFTIEQTNRASRSVAEKVGAVLTFESDKWWYLTLSLDG